MPLWFFLPFLLLFLGQAAPRIAGDSALNDEAWELTNGYAYWTQGEVRHEKTFSHPPFCMALQALPLLSLPLQAPPRGIDEQNRAHLFCFILNQDQAGRMFGAARCVTLLFGLALGWLLFFATRDGGPVLCGSALFFWALDPTFLAWSTAVKNDVPTAFLFLACVLLHRWLGERPSSAAWLGLGVAVGMACTCKMTALALFPSLLALDLFERLPLRELSKRWGLLLLGFSGWLLLLYAPGGSSLAWPWGPFQEFFERLQTARGLQGGIQGSFFLGHVQDLPMWRYLPVAFLLKNPWPFLILLLVALVLVLRRSLALPRHLVLPPIFLGAALLFASPQGVRYLLPAQPFFILWAAYAFKHLWDSASSNYSRAGRFLLAALLGAQALSLVLAFPHHLSYLNGLVPKERRTHLLGNYDLDVGQDFKRLARLARARGWDHIKLASSAMTDPSLYGLPWSRWTQKDLEGPQPGWVYVTTASFLQGAPAYYPQTYPIAMSWVRRLPPTRVMGDTLFIHEIPGKVLKDGSQVLDSVPYLRMDTVPGGTPSGPKSAP